MGPASAMPTYSIKHLLGTNDSILLDVCARQIAAQLAQAESPALPVLLGISLVEVCLSPLVPVPPREGGDDG